MKQRFLRMVLAAALAVIATQSRAEDIDLFTGSNPNAADLPNVLFIVDNTANWNQPFANEMAALANTFQNLPINKFRIGIMFATESGGDDNNIGGGYVRAAIRTMDEANKAKYKAMIQGFDKLNDKGNSGFSGIQMGEAYSYFNGGTPFSGNGKAKTDYTGNTCSECNLTTAQKSSNSAVYSLPGNALASKDATTYQSPIGSESCAKKFIIYISNGPNQEAANNDKIANDLLSTAGGSTTMIPLSPSGSQENPADEWARFMKESPLGVTTYTIDVDPDTKGQGPGWTALLKSMSAVSDGKYTAVSSSSGSGEISNAINKALSEIQSVNTVFASVSLPVSVNTQGTYLNQVYVGMFRPDANAFPRWAGNMKQYKLGLENGVLKLKDADDSSAINSSTGFITECARSFWTPTTVDTYWLFKPQGGCIPTAESGLAADAYKHSNFPDGNIVEKGAQGYKLRSTTSRTLKTCSTDFGSCTALTDFNTANSNITPSSVKATDSSEKDTFVNWGRGLDLQDENANDVTSAEMRPSAHGDIVHSRPVAINFGTDGAPKVVVFYGGNDGVFRAVNGNRTSAIGSTDAGSELWAFLPPEFYGSIKRLYDNTTLISYPNVDKDAISPTPEPKPYGVDGSVIGYDNGSSAWIYATMRRGARAFYAFDVNTANPANVTLKWKKGCPNQNNDSNCTSGFEGIGQTWSAPRILKAAGYDSGNSPMLIMGGGYDKCEDSDPNTCTSSSKGNKIYVLDANTGTRLTTLNTDRGVIADVIVAPDKDTGLAKYAYTADLGGNVYRITIGSAAPASWTITKVASLGCATTTSCTNNRKFMFVPDVVEQNGQYLLLLGSGDREKPLVSYSGASSVTNYFFMIKDKPSDSAWLTSESVNCSADVICLSSLVSIARDGADPTQAEVDAKKGWYLGLNSTEQVVTSAITIFGVVSFSTHEPEPPTRSACSAALGTTRLYNINYSNAKSENGTTKRYSVLPPVGLPPSPVAGMVTLDDGKTVAFCIGCDKDSPLEAKQPTVPSSSAPSEPKSRVFWFIEQ